MLDQQDLKWIATTSTELNTLLQQIARYCDLTRRHRSETSYLDLMTEQIEVASKTAQALFDKVTTQILIKATEKAKAPKAPHAPFTVLPPPTRVTAINPRSPVFASTETSARAAASTATLSAPAPGSASASIPANIPVKNPRGNRELILLIEDEAEVAELAAEMLAEEGYKVITAHDGFDALKIYQKLGTQIGLIILDFFLPVMDGDAVFDELRALNPNIDVVLSSGFAEQHKISSMLAQGLRGFIPKPYTREKLLGQIRTTLDAARQRIS